MPWRVESTPPPISTLAGVSWITDQVSSMVDGASLVVGFTGKAGAGRPSDLVRGLGSPVGRGVLQRLLHHLHSVETVS